MSEYYRNEVGLILYHVERVKDRFAMNDIHAVRVGIKRVKAVHRLMAHTYPERYRAKELNRPYRSLFRSLGKLREHQVCMALLRKHGGSRKLRKEYLIYRFTELEEIKREIRDAISSFSHLELQDTELYSLNEALSELNHQEERELLQRFIQGQRAFALQMIGSWNSDDELHKVRIKLKNIKPFLKLLAGRRQTGYIRRDFARLNRSEKLIGKWHDRLILSESLRLFGESIVDKPTLLKSCSMVLQRIDRRDSQKRMEVLSASVTKTLLSLERPVS